MTPPTASLISSPLKLYIWPVNHYEYPSYFVVTATNPLEALAYLKREVQETYGNTVGFRIYKWCEKMAVLEVDPQDGVVIELKGIADNEDS